MNQLLDDYISTFSTFLRRIISIQTKSSELSLEIKDDLRKFNEYVKNTLGVLESRFIEIDETDDPLLDDLITIFAGVSNDGENSAATVQESSSSPEKNQEKNDVNPEGNSEEIARENEDGGEETAGMIQPQSSSSPNNQNVEENETNAEENPSCSKNYTQSCGWVNEDGRENIFEDLIQLSNSPSNQSVEENETNAEENGPKEVENDDPSSSKSFTLSLTDHESDGGKEEFMNSLQLRDNNKVEPTLSNSQKFVAKHFRVMLEKMDFERYLQKQECLRRNCFVKIEPFKIISVSSESSDFSSMKSDNESGSASDVKLDEEIRRLCDLSTLERNERQYDEQKTNSSAKPKRKKLRKKRRRILCNSSSSEYSDSSSSSSFSVNFPIIEPVSSKVTNNNTEIDDQNFAEMISKYLSDDENDASDSHDLSSDDSGASTDYLAEYSEKENVLTGNKLKTNQTEEIKVKREIKSERDSWRNDPLLTENFTFTSNKTKKIKRGLSEDDSDSINKTRKKKRKLSDAFSSSDSDEILNNSIENSYDSDIQILSEGFIDEVLEIDNSDEDNFEEEIQPENKHKLSDKEINEFVEDINKKEQGRLSRLKKKSEELRKKGRSSDKLILDYTKSSQTISVDVNLSKKLYRHQVEGVKFMWNSCYENVEEDCEGTGCILAHNMGLGKTFQVVVFLHTLFSHSITKTSRVLIVCPLSTIQGWIQELTSGFEMAEKKVDVKILTLLNQRFKDRQIERWKTKGGILILNYQALVSLIMKSSKYQIFLSSHSPDLVICDEGHLLKNEKTLRTRALSKIETKRRIVLTGTPLQNNLKEYYHMVNFVKPFLLGKYSSFVRNFVNPIINGQYEDSDKKSIELMKKRSHVLQRLLKDTIQRYESVELKQYLPPMHDYAIFISLSPLQQKLYEVYIKTMAKTAKLDVKSIFKGFFVDYFVLKLICSHPRTLVTIREQKKLFSGEEMANLKDLKDDWFEPFCPLDIENNLSYGSRFAVMFQIIDAAQLVGDKVLIFSNSRVELKTVEHFLKNVGTLHCNSWEHGRDYLLMDGTVKSINRTKMCDDFNNKNNKNLRLFLITHQVGGLGLNLVAANRVILLGANFNPSVDAQSVFRVYRFGQTKTVYIYRLLSSGTMEEKIYNRCVAKLAVASRVVDSHQITRHFKNLDLNDLYEVQFENDDFGTMLNKPEDDLLSKIFLDSCDIAKFHDHQKLLENQPHEELNEDDKLKAWEEFVMFNKRNPDSVLPNLVNVPFAFQNSFVITNVQGNVSSGSFEESVIVIDDDSPEKNPYPNVNPNLGSLLMEPLVKSQAPSGVPSAPKISGNNSLATRLWSKYWRKTSSDDFQQPSTSNKKI